MTAGLQVRGDHGLFQITDEYPNLQFITRLSFSVDANGFGVATYSANNPLIFYRSNIEIVEVSNALSGGTWTLKFWSVSGDYSSVILFLFATAPAAPGGPGLEVYKSDGTLVYSTGYRQLRIIGIHNTAGGTPPHNATATQVFLPGGSAITYAVRLTYTRPGWYDAPFGGGNHTEQSVADAVFVTNDPSDQRILHGAFDWGPFRIAGGDLDNPSYNFLSARAPQILVADVTGM